MTDDEVFRNHLKNISHELLSGSSVVLIGPDREMVAQLFEGARVALEKSVKVFFSHTQKSSGVVTDSVLESDLERARSLGASYFAVADLQAPQIIKIMCDYGDLILLSSNSASHAFGISVAFAKELQKEFGEKSSLPSLLLGGALKALCQVGVSNSSPPPNAQGSFREKLLEARYNRTKSVVADHGSMLRGWTPDGDACDPGWELDK